MINSMNTKTEKISKPHINLYQNYSTKMKKNEILKYKQIE